MLTVTPPTPFPSPHAAVRDGNAAAVGANRVALQQGDAGTCAGMRIEPIYRSVQIPKVVTGLAAITQRQPLVSRL